MTALALTVLVPALAGVGLLLGQRLGDRAAVAVSLSAASVMVIASLVAAVQRPSISVPFMRGTDAGLAVDGLSALVLPAVAVVTLLVLIFSGGEHSAEPARFHGFMLLFAAAVAVTATATTLPALLIGWEVMGALSYALIGFRWREEKRVSAGLTAFITTRSADLGLYVAAGAALAGGAGLALGDLQDARSPWLHVIAAGMLVAALGKAAQLPFSFWLSRAMEGPSPVSALLHSAAMVAMGGYLLLRIQPLLEASGWAAPTAAWIGAATALLLGAVAVAQRDLKQLLAASTAAQLGFVVLAAGVGSVAGGVGFLVAHAATKAALFLAAGAWLSALGTKQLDALRGAARRWPVVGGAFTVAVLSLAGVAPLSLWATKDHILAATLESGPALFVVALAAAALSAVYSGKALIVLWAEPTPHARFDTERRGSRRIGIGETVPVAVLAGASALFGLVAVPRVWEGVTGALGLVSGPEPTIVELVGSALLAATVLGSVWLLARREPRKASAESEPSAASFLPEPRWAAGWLGLERAAHAVIVRPTLAMSERLARFDDRSLDRVVQAVGQAGVRSAQGLARVDDAVVDEAVERMSRATVSAARATGRADLRGIDGLVEHLAHRIRQLGKLARRPQTGRIHQYYAQSSVVLAVLFVVLLIVR